MDYTYDPIGQLKTALGKEANTAPRLQEQFGYKYDAAGNLNYRTNNALVQTFNANDLNELSAKASQRDRRTIAPGKQRAARGKSSKQFLTLPAQPVRARASFKSI